MEILVKASSNSEDLVEVGENVVVQSHKVELNGVRLHYVEANSVASGPPVVFLHGLSGSHAEFLHLVPQLAQHAPIYFLDMRGHGLSAHVGDGYLVKDYARDVVAFLSEVAGEPVVLLGHSLGGLVGAWIAAHQLQTLLGLILVDPAFYVLQMPAFAQSIFYPYFTDLRRYLRAHHRKGAPLQEMIKYVGEAPVDGARTVLDVAGPDAVRDRAIQLHQMDPAAILPVLAVADPALGDTLLDGVHPDHLLREIHCPVHLLAAEYNRGGALREVDVQRTVSHLPHSSHFVVHGAGHDIHLDRPNEFVRQLIQFLEVIKQEVI